MAEEGPERGLLGGLLGRLAENGKARRALLALGAAGIALLFLSGLFSEGDNAKEEANPAQAALTTPEYAERLEQRLSSLVNGITGETDAQVLVTLEQGTQYIYATEQRSSSEKTEDPAGAGRNQENNSLETSYLLVRDADGAQRALAVTERQPVVQGVVVLCRSAGRPELEQHIVDAVTTALQISSARVCVIPKNESGVAGTGSGR